MSTVTRQEIRACTRGAFGSGWVGRDQLCAAARSAGARREVVETLEKLSPRVRVCGVPDLLLLLPELPDGDEDGDGDGEGDGSGNRAPDGGGNRAPDVA
ncbi:hypothetical protein [Streptomyces sp. CC228A]|uniref:hypothetical protein n=1 Tax=Streptomyces sp. CC228A TaxID=2898186 RepID=UPI001F41DB76|nr:hypothetical protein [Streptomyces sp. CC228A]